MPIVYTFQFLKMSKTGSSKHMPGGWPFIALLLWHLPYFIAGENAGILIFDNLDSVIPWYKILLEKKLVFADPATEVPGIMQGLLRSSLPGIDVALLMFKLFGMYYGYVINKLLMSLVAYSGMLLLLKNLIPQNEKHLLVLRCMSLLYALLPFWSVTLSVAGLPMLCAAFIQLYRHERKIASLMMIIVYGIGSSLVLTGIFIFFMGGLYWLVDSIRNKRIHFAFTAGFILLAAAFAFSHYPVISSTLFNSEYVTHRTEMRTMGGSFLHSMKEMIQIGLFGQVHAHSLHTLLIVPFIIVLAMMWRKQSLTPIVYMMLTYIFVTSVLYGLLTWEALSNVKQKLMTVFPVQLQRFHFFQPMLWYILFTISSVFLIQQFRQGKKIFISIVCVQLLYLMNNHEMVVSYDHPSFQEFFAESTFRKMKEDIPEMKNHRCMSIAMHPSIAQWNGLQTLDGYFADYPLQYKHAFRNLIAPELERDENIRAYYDNWGSRCYVFTAAIGKQIPLQRNQGKTISSPLLNLDEALELDCRFILSGFKLQETEPRLKLSGSYDAATNLPIFVYEIN